MTTILQVCSLITAISTAVAIIVKPIREKLFGTRKIEDGQKCMLRAEMLAIYYKGRDHDNKIRQYEFENFVLMYGAYKALGGNSFIDKINKEVQEMEVIT